MYAIIKRLKKRPLRTIAMSLVLLMLFSFTGFSYGMKTINQEVSNYLFKNLGVNLILYGDINDIYGYAEDENQYKAIYEKYKEIISGLNDIGDNDIIFEEYLQTYKIYSGKNIYDDVAFKAFYFDNSYAEFNNHDGFLSGLSKDLTNNNHYKDLIEKNYRDPSLDEPSSVILSGLYPTLIGVNKAEFSDINLGYMNIKDGRLFNDDELGEGKYKAIINNYTYVYENNSLRKAKVGDILPITIEAGDYTKTYEFEIIGVVNSDVYGGISVPFGLISARGSEFYLSNQYFHYVYIPYLCFDEIRDDYLNACADQNILLTKEDDLNIGLIGNEYYYSQHGGIRPMVINVETLNSLNIISDYLRNEILELNKISNRVIDYTYFSNLDSFATVISSATSANKLFIILSYISILSCGLFFILYIRNDLEKSQKEIGIYISLGMSKMRVIFDKFLEYVTISIIPLIVSFVISSIYINRYVEHLNNSVVEIGLGSKLFGGYADEIVVGLPIQYTFIYLLIILACIIVANVIGYLKIRKMNVKDILMDGELI